MRNIGLGELDGEALGSGRAAICLHVGAEGADGLGVRLELAAGGDVGVRFVVGVEHVASGLPIYLFIDGHEGEVGAFDGRHVERGVDGGVRGAEGDDAVQTVGGGVVVAVGQGDDVGDIGLDVLGVLEFPFTIASEPEVVVGAAGAEGGEDAAALVLNALDVEGQHDGLPARRTAHAVLLAEVFLIADVAGVEGTRGEEGTVDVKRDAVGLSVADDDDIAGGHFGGGRDVEQRVGGRADEGCGVDGGFALPVHPAQRDAALEELAAGEGDGGRDGDGGELGAAAEGAVGQGGDGVGDAFKVEGLGHHDVALVVSLGRGEELNGVVAERDDFVVHAPGLENRSADDGGVGIGIGREDT